MSVTLTVMSFNLHDDQPPESSNSWEKRRDLCISVITSYSPAILCTQQGISLFFLLFCYSTCLILSMLADLDLGCDFVAIIHLGFCLFEFFWWVFGSVGFRLSFWAWGWVILLESFNWVVCTSSGAFSFWATFNDWVQCIWLSRNWWPPSIYLSDSFISLC